MTNNKWWPGREQKRPTRNGKVSASTPWALGGLLAGASAHGVGAVCRQPLGTCLLVPWQCNLTGWWENELGSRMHVSTVDSEGNFSGEYHTAVSSAEKPIEPSPLVGSQHLDEDGQCTFGFTVNWKFSGRQLQRWLCLDGVVGWGGELRQVPAPTPIPLFPLLSPVCPSLISPHSGRCPQTAGHLLRHCLGQAALRVALTASLPQSISLQTLGPTWAP